MVSPSCCSSPSWCWSWLYFPAALTRMVMLRPLRRRLRGPREHRPHQARHRATTSWRSRIYLVTVLIAQFAHRDLLLHRHLPVAASGRRASAAGPWARWCGAIRCWAADRLRGRVRLTIGRAQAIAASPRTAWCRRATSPSCPWTASSSRRRPAPRPCPWTWCSWAAARPGWPAPSSWRGWCKKDKEAGGGLGDVEIARAGEGRDAGRALPLGRGREPVGAPRAVPGAARTRTSRCARRSSQERVYFLTGGARAAHPHAAHHAEPRQLRGVALRDRALAGREGRGAGRQHVHRASRPTSLLVEGDARGGRAHHAVRARSATARPAAATRRPPTSRRRSRCSREGTRGPLTQAWLQWQQVGSDNPQIFALGVKELWETKRPLDARHPHAWAGRCPRDAFGGSFMYPLEPNLVALGLVVGLDYHDATLDVHVLLQRMKQHPLFRPYLEGGEMVEWGAKTIPEGGYYSLPRAAARRRRAGRWATPPASWRWRRSRASTTRCSRACFAARAIFAALKQGDTSAAALAAYDRAVDASVIVTRPARAAEHAPRLQGRLLPGRHQGRPDDAHAAAPSPADASRSETRRRGAARRSRRPSRSRPTAS